MSDRYFTSSKSPLVVYKNGGYGINFKNNSAVEDILNNTKSMYELAKQEQDKRVNTNFDRLLSGALSFKY